MTAALGVLIGVLALGMVLRAPVGFSMLAGGIAYLAFKRQDMGLAAEQVLNGLYNSYVLLAVPLFLPVFVSQNVDLVWLAMLICVNLQTSFLTPPFGWALFFLRGVAPPQVTTRHMYVGIMPFVAMQIITVVLVFMFPQIALWLPDLYTGR